MINKYTFLDGYISGRCKAILCLLAMEKSVLAKLLPDKLELARQSLTDADFHPVIWSFMLSQSEVSTLIPGFYLSYREFILTIPYVRPKDTKEKSGIFSFAPLLYQAPSTEREAPDFIELSGSILAPHPFMAQGGQFFSFIFKSDMHILQQVCDQWFNKASKNQKYYRPLTADVQVTFGYNSRARSIYNDAYFNQGYADYYELVFSFYIVSLKKEAGVWVAEKGYAFMPYIFVDSDMAVTTGREIYGVPKTIAKIEMPLSHHDPLSFRASTKCIKTFTPNTAAMQHELISIRPITNTDQEPSVKKIAEMWHDTEQVFKEIKKLIFTDKEITLPGLELMIEAKNLFTNSEFPFISLKQIRDVHNGGKACYQAIVEFYCKMAKFNGAGFLGNNFEIEINALDSYPIAKDLGLNGAGQQARAAFWLNWDYAFGNGREVWRA